MRFRLATALTLLSAPFAAGPGLAADPVAEGATATVSIKVAVRDSAKSDFASSTIERLLNAQCLMQAGPPSQIGMDGPTPEQEAAMKVAGAKAEALGQQMAPSMPSEEMVASLEAEAAKCGDDQACMMAMAAKLQNNAEFMATAQAAAGAQAAVKAATPDLGPTRYQLWMPKSCSGTLVANDVYVDSDPGGEGGDGAYTDTITVQGQSEVDPAWHGLMMETDLVAGTTRYRLMAPPPVNIPSQSTRQGAGQRQIPLLAGTALPETVGPLQGVGGTQATQLQGTSGTVTLEFKR